MKPSPRHAPPRSRSRRAFSLIELMVVVTIIGLLAGITIPVIQSIQSQGRAVTELSAARAAAGGWRTFAEERDGELLKGYYPDSTPSNEPLYDFEGRLIPSGPTQQRWFWRLTQYVNDPRSVFFPNSLETLRRQVIDTGDNYQYTATLYPAMGLNGEWIGGLGEELGNELYALYEYGGLTECPYARRISDIKRPSSLMLFSSARYGSTEDNSDVGASFPGIIQGFYRITSPVSPRNGFRWPVDENGSTIATMTDKPVDHGYVSARHSNKAVTAMVDGSTQLQTIGDLADMRRWADQAWKADWQLMP